MIQTAVTDVVSPTVATEDPDALLDQVIGQEFEPACGGIGDAGQLLLEGRHADALRLAESASETLQKVPNKTAQARALALLGTMRLEAGDARAALQRHLTPEQVAELGLGVTLFLALAKALITMGLEPEEMDRTVLPTPAVLEAAE
jgi:hypothetical protein